MNVDNGLDSHASFICQNPDFAASLENTLEPANLPNICLQLEVDGSPS